MARTIKELQAKFGKRRLKETKALYSKWRNAQPDTSTMPGMLVLRNINGSNKAQYIQFYRDAIRPRERAASKVQKAFGRFKEKRAIAQKVLSNSKRLSNVWETLMQEIKGASQNQIRVHMMRDGKHWKYKDYNRNTVKKATIWYDFFYGGMDERDDEYRNAEDRYKEGDAGVYFVLEEGQELIANQMQQVYSENTTHTCLFDPIVTWCEQMMEKSTSDTAKKIITIHKKAQKYIARYPHGVPEDDIQGIVDDLGININIHKILQKRYAEFQSKKQARKSFDYINTRKDHVEEGKGGDILACTPINCTPEELLDIYAKEKTKGGVVAYRSFDGNLSRVYTSRGAYQTISESAEIISKFEEATGLANCKLDWNKDADVSQFIQDGTHFNGTVDFQDVDNYRHCCNENRCGSASCCSARSCCRKCCTASDNTRTDFSHMDCLKQYANARKASGFKGFLGKVSNFRKCSTMTEGAIGIYQIRDVIIHDKQLKRLNKKMNIYQTGGIYPQPELEMLQKYATFEIVRGAWGSVIDFDFHEHEGMMKKVDGINMYSKYVGKCASKQIYQRIQFEGTEEELADMLYQAQQQLTYEDYYYDKEAKCLSVNFRRQSAEHLCHISSFVTSYCRMHVLEQLMSMNVEDIIRVCVDGIYYTGEYECLNIFRNKPEYIKLNAAWKFYVELPPPQDHECGKEKHYSERVLLNGVGGGGKTHDCLTDVGYVRACFVAPSNKLSRQKKNQYNCASKVWFAMTGPDYNKTSDLLRRYNTFFIDEVSMMTECEKRLIFKRFKGCHLIFMGDIGYQTEAWDGEELNISGFGHCVQYTYSHRIKCEKLREVCDSVRAHIHNPKKVFNIVKDNFEHVSVEEVASNYVPEDMILCRSNEKKDGWSDTLKDHDKWYVTATGPLYAKGEIVIGDKPKGATSERRHGYTVHSIQGETCEHTLYIDMRGMKSEPRILYTAISRARYARQIKLVNI